MDLLLIWSFSSFPDWKVRIFPESWSLKKFHILLIFSASPTHGLFEKELSTDHPCFSIRPSSTCSTNTVPHRKSPPTRSYIFCMPSTAAIFCQSFFATRWFGWGILFRSCETSPAREKILKKHGQKQAGFDSSRGLGVSRLTVIKTTFFVS